MEDNADSRDCLSLTDRLAPLCCLGEANQTVLVNDTCAECDACLVDGMCIHASLDNPSLNKSDCLDIGTWCPDNGTDSQALAQDKTVKELKELLVERASMASMAEAEELEEVKGLDSSITGKDVCGHGYTTRRRGRAPLKEYQAVSWSGKTQSDAWHSPKLVNFAKTLLT